jgi:hypothetical protein
MLLGVPSRSVTPLRTKVAFTARARRQRIRVEIREGDLGDPTAGEDDAGPNGLIGIEQHRVFAA